MIVSTATSMVSAASRFLLPSDNPREKSIVQNSATYISAMCIVPWVFEQLGGEAIGATFTMVVLFLHLMALTGKDEPEVATKNAMDVKNSANTLITGVMTYAFLISAIKQKNEYYSTTAPSAKAWMVSLVGAILFMLPSIPFPVESYEAYYIRQYQYIVMSFVLGFFVSGIVLSTKK